MCELGRYNQRLLDLSITAEKDGRKESMFALVCLYSGEFFFHILQTLQLLSFLIARIFFQYFCKFYAPFSSCRNVQMKSIRTSRPSSGLLSPSASTGPGSPGRSWRTRSSRWTEPSWCWRSASTRRGWTGCWATCPPAPCWTAATLRPSETARGGGGGGGRSRA